MIEQFGLLALSLGGAWVAAWAVASVVVDALDALGLCYSVEREARAHAGEPAPRFLSAHIPEWRHRP